MYSPLSAEVVLTKNCNLSCSYCFVSEKEKAYNLNWDALESFIDSAQPMTLSVFGGEPLLRFDLIKKIYAKNPAYFENNAIITNGILIKRHIDEIKDMNINFQISLDGNEKTTDANRGKGVFKRVMESVEECVKHKIDWSFHGVSTRKNIPDYADNIWTFWEVYKKHFTIDQAISKLSGNTVSNVMEEDYDDNDIDLYFKQIDIIIDRINADSDLTDANKAALAKSMLHRKVNFSDCSGGTGFVTLDSEMNVYPCHRMLDYNGGDSSMGAVSSPNKNFNLFNAFFYAHEHGSLVVHPDLKSIPNGGISCMAGNINSGYDIQFPLVKYSIFASEVGRYIDYKISECFGGINGESESTGGSSS
jgi:sulfatase maturation enzyme AslB (radical SAM superfamily)